MPQLKALPRPPALPGGLPSNPIDPAYDRYYVLDEAGAPRRCYDYTEHAMWMICDGKAWQIKDLLPEYAVEVWTYFSGWASLRDDKPPMFRTTVNGGMSKSFESETWEEAEDKHRRVLEDSADLACQGRVVAALQKSEAGGAASPELLRNGFTGKAK